MIHEKILEIFDDCGLPYPFHVKDLETNTVNGARMKLQKGIDLIAIASLRRTGIAKYLIGSVARNVLKGTKCAVLLTKR